MQKLTDAQDKCLSIMIANPEVHPYEVLGYIRNPQIRDRVVNSLVKNGWLVRDVNPNKFLLSNQALDHYGLELPWDAAEENTIEIVNEEMTESEAEDDKAEDTFPSEENGSALMKKVKINKKRTLIQMLEREATLDEFIKMTGWKKASVRGVMSTIQKESGRQIVKHESDGDIKYGFESVD